MQSVQITHTFKYEGTTLNIYHANKNQGLMAHSHSYSHAIICNNGKCLVSLEGRSYTMTKKSQPLNLPAGEWHEIEALENETVFVTVFAEGKTI